MEALGREPVVGSSYLCVQYDGTGSTLFGTRGPDVLARNTAKNGGLSKAPLAPRGSTRASPCAAIVAVAVLATAVASDPLQRFETLAASNPCSSMRPAGKG